MNKLIPAIILLCNFCVSGLILADDSFRWKDPDGKTVYGSKPPANARDVERFSTRKISRYSSSKVLERSDTTEEQEVVNNEESDSSGEVFKDKRLAPPSKGTRSIVSGQIPELRPLEPILKINKLGEIVACKVEVLNKGELPVQDVSVAFEFFDGTLIPGAGPFVIPPDGKGLYEIPEALLPLYFSFGDVPEAEEEIPLPQVIVHGSLY
jgi:hypothetical protein